MFWSWFAATEQQVRDHLAAAVYDVRLNGTALQYRPYATNIRQEDGRYIVYWFVPSQPLTPGQYTISYRVTWTRAISDGFDEFGPGTPNTLQTGSCTFTVR
ncbi:MAG: hypothetical protein HC828_11615 [Blastochloris sp.]|nr:hypothetical protein [Blastochloris sp.]